MIQIRTLGGFGIAEVGEDGAIREITLAPRQASVLVYLALSRPQGRLSRETLLGVFWPELSESRARAALSTALYRLRIELGRDLVVNAGDCALELHQTQLESDVAGFEDALERGDLDAALDCYQGELLVGFHLADTPGFEQWLDGERTRLSDRAVDTALTRALQLEDGHNPAGAVNCLRRALQWSPYAEPIVRELTRLLALLGDLPGATHEYQKFAKRLSTDLDLQPSSALEEHVATLAFLTPRQPATSVPPTSSVAEPLESANRGAASSDFMAAPDHPPVAVESGWRRRAAVAVMQHRARLAWPAVAVVAALMITGAIRSTWGTETADGVEPGGSGGVPGSEETSPGPPWRARTNDTPVAGTPRVAVLVLENRTGDRSLEPLGLVAADALVQGIARTGLVDVVADQPTLASRGEAESDRTPDAGPAMPGPLGVRAGADLVVRGSYDLTGDFIRLQAQVIDGHDGSVLRILGPVAAGRSDPTAAIQILRNRVSGAVATLADPYMASWSARASVAPSYEAYREFADGLQLLRGGNLAPSGQGSWEAAIELFLRAGEHDSTFTQPLLRAVHAMIRVGRRAAADTLAHRLLARSARMPLLDRTLLEANLAGIRRDYEGSLEAYRRVVALAPGSEFVLDAAEAAGLARQPGEAVHLLRAGAAAFESLRQDEYYWTLLGRSLHALGQFEDELLAARSKRALPVKNLDSEYNALLMEGRALAAEGRIAELLAVYDTFVAVIDKQNDYANWGDYLVMELLAHGHETAAPDLTERVLSWYEQKRALGQDDLWHFYWRWGEVLVIAGRWSEARACLEEFLKKRPDMADVRAERAFVAAKLGDPATALADQHWLEALDPRDPESGLDRNPFMREFYLAVIAAGLGERERALSLIRLSIRNGNSGLFAFRHRPYFADFRGDREFETLISPRR